MHESDSYEEVLEFAIDREIDANQFYLGLEGGCFWSGIGFAFFG